MGLASRDSAAHEDAGLHFTLLGRLGEAPGCPAAPPDTPGAGDPVLTLLSHPCSKALGSPSCHLPLESGGVPVGRARTGGAM